MHTPKVKPPPVPAPEATPDASMSEQAGESYAKQQARRNGFAKTLITGDLTPQTNKKTLLGG